MSTELILSKTLDSWFGVVGAIGQINTTVIDPTIYSHARVRIVLSEGAGTHYAPLTWVESTQRFEGDIHIGDWHGIGCAEPQLGLFFAHDLRLELSSKSDFSTINYNSPSKSLQTQTITRRATRSSNDDYMEYNPVFDGTKWIASVKNFGAGYLIGQNAPTDVVVAIPFHPITAQINVTNVTIEGITAPKSNSWGTGDGWWWDNSKHTLYVRVHSINWVETQGSTQSSHATRINFDFESDTDLFVTRIDSHRSSKFAECHFINGLVLCNQYYYTTIWGGTLSTTNDEGFSGVQVETRARKEGQTKPISVDCYERVGVFVDDTHRANADAKPYPQSIRWNSNEWKDLILSENNNELVVKTTSSNAWQQQADTGIQVERLVSIRAGQRYGKQDYKLTNTGTIARKYPFVWGKEPWAGLDRATNDRGIFAGDTVSRTVDAVIPIENLFQRWMLHYDEGVFAGMGVIFHQSINGKAYFLKTASIRQDGADYPIPVNSHATAIVENMFFETVFNNVEPSQSVYLSFYQGQYSGSDLNALTSMVEEDYAQIVPQPAEYRAQTRRSLVSNYVEGSTSFDSVLQVYQEGLTESDIRQTLYSDSLVSSDLVQVLYADSSTLMDTLLQIVDNSIEITGSAHGVGSTSIKMFETLLIKGQADGHSSTSVDIRVIELLAITVNSADGIGETTGIIQVVSNDNRIIKGTVNLNSSPTKGATVIAVEPTLMKIYKATTLSDGTYEVSVNDAGTYHVLTVYMDVNENKYSAMVQPYVEIV